MHLWNAVAGADRSDLFVIVVCTAFIIPSLWYLIGSGLHAH